MAHNLQVCHCMGKLIQFITKILAENCFPFVENKVYAEPVRDITVGL